LTDPVALGAVRSGKIKTVSVSVISTGKGYARRK
jgi:hypothetical protein